jgi:HD-GYP domain-containing protein (c-di-GMP phosphodiesterase class II)
VAGTLAKQLAANQLEDQLDKSEAVAEEIGRYVKSQFDRLELISDAFTLDLARAQPAGTVDEATAWQLLERNVGAEGILELQLLPTRGEAAAIRTHEPAFDPDQIAKELDPELAIALDKGSRGSRYLSDPFLPADRPQHPLALFAVPVKPLPTDERGGVPYVLTAVVNMSVVQGFVQQVGGATAAGEYTVFVLGDDLRPFAHTQYLKVVERASMADSPLVQEFLRYGVSSAASKEFDEQSSSGEVRHMVGAYRPVPLELEEHRWGVFVQVDRELGFFQVQELWKTTLQWGLIAFGLAVVIGVIFSWRITDPIHALAESTRRVAGGEYGRRVRVSSNDELGMLADNFNAMSEAIRKTIDELQAQHEINDQLFLSSIRSLAAAIDARDPYTRGHSDRVTRFSIVIARQLGLASEKLRSVEIGALLHDVGKIGIEDRILRKPSALTPEEFEIMKTHPEKGGDIMAPISYLREATEIIIHHHERWDGTGYPSGLKGEEIPLGARIVSVADTFDAMTTNRPYQRAMTYAVAAKKIGEFAGKGCDPAVVRAFHEALEGGHFGPSVSPRAVETPA